MITLSDILVGNAQDHWPKKGQEDHSVSRVNGQERRLSDLRRDAAKIACCLQGQDANAVCLYSESAYDFTAGLLGAVYSLKRVILPPNNLPETLTSIAKRGALILSETENDLPSIHLRKVMDGPPRPFEFRSRDLSNVTLDIQTSGSTGVPTFVPKTLHQLEAECASLERMWGKALGSSLVFAMVSHQHIYGLLFRVLWPLLAMRPFVAETIQYWEAYFEEERDRDHVLVSSPAHLSRFPPLSALDPLRPPKMLFSSGGPLTCDAAEKTKHSLGVAPCEVFGSTETGGIAWRVQKTPDTAWTAFDQVSISRAEDGTLAVRSPWLEKFEWQSTSDLISLLDETRFQFHGRADRIVKIEGKRVSLQQVETALLAEDSVHSAAVLMLKNAPCPLAAVLELSDKGRAMLETLGPFRLGRAFRRRLGTRLDSASLPKFWRFVDHIPENAQGKRRLLELQQLFADDEITNPAPLHPTVLERRESENQVTLDLVAPANLFYFQGHFPKTPILPGVTQLHWAVLLAGEAFGRPMHVNEISRLKYKQVWRPEMKVTLHLVYRPEKKTVSFTYSAGELEFSSGTLKVILP